MFGTSKRFVSEAVSDIPGPNAYNYKTTTLLSDDPNKHFGFIDKSKRFRSPSKDERPFHLDSERDGEPVPAPRMAEPSKSERDEVMRLKKEAERWQEQFEKQQAMYEKDLSMLNDKIQRLDFQLQTSTKDKNKLQTQVTTKEKQILELTKSEQVLRISLEKAQKLSESYQTKAQKAALLQKRIDELEKSQTKVKSLTEKKFAHDNETLLNQVKSLKAQMESLTEEKEAAMKAHQQLKAERKGLKVKLDDTSSQLDEVSLRWKQASTQFELDSSQLKQKIATLTAQLENENSEFSTTTKSLRASLSEAQVQLTESTASFEKQKRAYLDRIGQLEGDLESAQKKLVSKDQELSRLSQELRHAQERYHQDTKSLNEENNELALKLENELREARAQAEKDANELQELTSQLKSVMESRDQERHEMEHMIRKLKALIDKLEKDQKSLTQHYKSKVAAKESLLEQQDQTLNQVRSQLQMLRQEAKDKEESLRSVSQEKGNYEEVVRQTEHKLHAAQSDLMQLQEQYDATVSEYTSTIHRLEQALESNEGLYKKAIDETIEEKNQVMEQARELRSLLLESEGVRTAEVDELNKIIGELRAKLDMQSKFAQSAQKEFNERLSESVSLVQDLNARVDQLQKALDDEQASHQQTKAQSDEAKMILASSLQENQDKLAQLEAEYETVLTTKLSLEAKLSESSRSFTGEKSAMQKELESLVKAKSEMEETIKHSRIMCSKLESSLSAKESENQMLSSCLVEMKSLVADESYTSRFALEQLGLTLEDCLVDKSLCLTDLLQSSQDRRQAQDHNDTLYDDIASLEESAKQDLVSHKILAMHTMSYDELMHRALLITSHLQKTHLTSFDKETELLSALHDVYLNNALLQDKLNQKEIAAEKLQSSVAYYQTQIAETSKRFATMFDDMLAEQAEVDKYISQLEDDNDNLTSSIASLSSDLKTAQSLTESRQQELDRSIQEINALNERVEESQQMYNQLSEEKEKLERNGLNQNAALTSLQNTIEKQLSELASVEEQKRGLERHVSNLEERLVKSKDIYAELEGKYTQAAKDLEETNVSLTQSHNELQQTKLALSELESTSVQEKQELSDILESARQTHEKERTSYESRIQSLETSISESQLKLEEMTASDEERISQLTNTLKETQSQLRQTTQDLAIEQGKVSGLMDMLNLKESEALAEKESKVLELRRLQAQLERVEAEHGDQVRDLTERLDLSGKEAIAANNKVTLLNTELESITTKLLKTSQELETVKESSAKIEKEMNSMRAEWQNREVLLKKELGLKEEAARKAKHTLDVETNTFEKTIEELSQKLSERSMALKRAENELNDAKGKLSLSELRLANELSSRDLQIKNLDAKLKQRIKHCEQLEATISKISSEMTLYQEKGNKMQQEYESLKAAEDELVKEREAFQREKIQIEMSISEYETQIKTLEEEVAKMGFQVEEAERTRTDMELKFETQLRLLNERGRLNDSEMKRISDLNAELFGHANTRQKIKHLAQVKEENMTLKKSNLALSREKDLYRKKVMDLERELEAYRAVGSGGTGRKMSRVARTVLSSRTGVSQSTRSTLVPNGENSFMVMDGKDISFADTSFAEKSFRNGADIPLESSAPAAEADMSFTVHTTHEKENVGTGGISFFIQ